MSYVNLVGTFDVPLHNWILKECVPNCIGARVGFFMLTPLSLVSSVFDTAIGASVAPMAIVHKGSYHFAMNHLNSSKHIIVHPYMNLLRVLNPQAEFSANYGEKEGFLTHYVSRAIKYMAQSFYKSENIFVRHVASRFSYIVLAIASVVTRALDLIIGIIAALISLCTLGTSKSVNNLAIRGLQVTGIIHDVFYCSIKVINPGAGT